MIGVLYGEDIEILDIESFFNDFCISVKKFKVGVVGYGLEDRRILYFWGFLMFGGGGVLGFFRFVLFWVF